MLEEAELRAREDHLGALQALLLLGALLLNTLVVIDEEVAGLVEVVRLLLQHVQRAFLSPLGLLGLLKLCGLLGLLPFLGDNELRVIRALRGGVGHRLLVVLLRLLLVALALGNVHLGVLDHLVHHRNDAAAALALLVLPEGLGGWAWLSSARLCEGRLLLLHEVLLLLLRGFLVQR